MPVTPPEFHPLGHGLSIWQNYDSSVKADLFATAVTTATGIFLIDPIPLHRAQLKNLSEQGQVAGIILTNVNHQRSAAEFSDQFAVPTFGRVKALAGVSAHPLTEVIDGQTIGGELEVIAIEGAVAGEIVLYHPAADGTLIVGDALINFAPYGFTFLPSKYCREQKQMRGQLRKLLSRKAERLLFAHGTPILSGASARLQQLLDS